MHFKPYILKVILGLSTLRNINFRLVFIYLDPIVMRCKKESRNESGDFSEGEILTTRQRARPARMYEVKSITQVPMEKEATQLAREYREAGES